MNLRYAKTGCALALLTGLYAGGAAAKANNSQDLVKSLFNSYKKQQVTSVAEAARKSRRLAGTAISSGPLFSDEGYQTVLNAEYDYVTPENEGKWESLQPGGSSVWEFATHDAMFEYAEDNDKVFRGHTLVWHSQAPSFITEELSATEVSSMLNAHVTKTVKHYAGDLFAWDVVNEAIEEDGSYRNSIFYKKLGPQYIADAFRLVRSLDPKSKLYYNDYNIAGINAKSNGVYNMLKGLKAAGVPIDGIGFQMHLSVDNAPGFDEIRANFKRFADLGLDINISELDVRVASLPWDQATKMAIQKQIYQRIISACMHVQKCESVTTWGFTDMYSWVDATYGADDPLPFDDQFQKKPAYFGLIDGLMALPPDAPDANPNMIANGNVEAGLEGWSNWGGELQRVHKISHNGESSLKVTSRTARWNGPIYDLLGVMQARQTYNVEAWAAIRGSKQDNMALNAHYRCAGSADQYVQLAQVTAKELKWTRLAGTLTLPECTLEAAAIYLDGPAPKVELLADAVSARPLTLIPDATGLGPNIVSNADFELDEFGWFGFGDAQVSASAAQANTGSQSGYVSARTASWQGPATSLLLEAEPGTEYQILAWVRMASGRSQINATVKAVCPAGEQYLSVGSAQASATGWRTISGKVAIPDCPLNELTLYFEGPDAGASFFMDDVYVRQVLATSEPNLIASADFENGVGDWTAWGGASLVSSTTHAHTGMRSAVLTNRSGSWQGPVLNILNKVVPGATYDITGWGRIAGAAADNLFITVKTVCADGAENYLQADAITATDSEWQQLQGSVTLPACALTEVSLYFDGPNAGVDVYLDDVIVVGEVNDGPVNLVTNPGFESGLTGWTAWGGALSLSSDAYAGVQSVYHSNRTGNWQGPVYNLLPVVAGGSTYDIQAFSKITGAASADLSVTVKTVCVDGSSAYNWAGGNTVNSTAWTEVVGSLTLPSCELTEVSLYFDGPADPVGILLDEVSVIAAP